MKLTWFGGRTFRVQIGGRIVVLFAGEAPEGIDRHELLAAADREIGGGERLQEVDPLNWRQKKLPSELDATPVGLDVVTLGESLLMSIPGEPPLVLAFGALPSTMGRWIEGAVVVLSGAAVEAADTGLALLADRPPRLLLLALTPSDAGQVFQRLVPALGETGMMALEPRLAIEA